MRAKRAMRLLGLRPQPLNNHHLLRPLLPPNLAQPLPTTMGRRNPAAALGVNSGGVKQQVVGFDSCARHFNLCALEVRGFRM